MKQLQFKDAMASFNHRHIPEPNSGCWLWTGAVNSDGYGNITVSGKSVGAHRFSLQTFVGAPPHGKNDASHICDMPLCVNPEHLFWASRSENIMDSVKKKRHYLGAKTHCPSGHAYSPENTYSFLTKDGGIGRACRSCMSLKKKRQRAQKRIIQCAG